MAEPVDTTHNQQTQTSDITQDNIDQFSPQPASGTRRIWLLVVLLMLVIILLIVRDDLRQDAAKSSDKVMRFVAFDMLGWSPRDAFIWRLRLAGLVNSPLGQRWTNAVERASTKPVMADSQFYTTQTFKDDEVEAHVYQLALERGEKLLWQFSRLDNTSNRLYVSLERRENNQRMWTTVMDVNEEPGSRCVYDC